MEIFESNLYMDFMSYMKSKGMDIYLIVSPKNQEHPVLTTGTISTMDAMEHLQTLLRDKSRKESRDFEAFAVPKMSKPWEKLGIIY